MPTAPPTDAQPADAPTADAASADPAPTEAELKADLDAFRADFRKLREEVGRVIVGHENIVTGTLTALVAGGHVLLEGVPGLGKTLLVNTLADALAVTFGRVQFTPDLMPADLVGTNVFLEDETGRKRFEFQKGPVFAHVLLADEVNRATPKTQSALLEAMQEKSVTVGGVTHKLPSPFLVLATQNPLEMEGTYPLPEAQLDRFFVKLLVEFPTAGDLGEILNRTTSTDTPAARPVLDGDRVLAMRKLARQVPVADAVRDRAVALVLATHPNHPSAPDAVKKYVRFGSSPRGAQAIVLAAKVRAILDGRFHVSREDLHDAAPAVLRHRLILGFEGQAEGVSPDAVIAEVVKGGR